MCYKGNVEGIITNIQRFSLHDGGGIRSVAFLKGCPFRCPWCSNPETISFQPEQMIEGKIEAGKTKLVGEKVTSAVVVRKLERDCIFYEESQGGITLSGGECLAQFDFALDILKGCKEQGIHTAIETTLGLPVDIDALANACNLFLVDFKISDPARSRNLLNLDPNIRNENVSKLVSNEADIVARMPVIRGYNDDAQSVMDNLDNICELGISRVDILPFHQYGSGKYEKLSREYELEGVEQLGEKDVVWIADEALKRGLTPVINGE